MIFEKLIDFIEYIPKCIICGKSMHLIFSKYYYKNVCLKSKLHDNGLLVCTNSNDNVIIDINSNLILDGSRFFNEKSNGISVTNKCKTCRFKIITRFSKINKLKYIHYIPKLKLFSESISYYNNNHKPNSVHINYINRVTFINNKLYNKNIYNIFSKTNNLEQFRKKLSILLTFS